MKTTTNVVPQPSAAVKAMENRIAMITEFRYRSNRTPLVLWILITLVTFSSGLSVNGQTDPIDPKRGAAPGASFSLSDIENINLTNGNLMLNMPLVSLPPTRGGLKGSMGVVYNSKIFKPVVEEIVVGLDPTDQNVLYQSDEGGWRSVSSLSYQLKLTYRFTSTPAVACEEGMGPHFGKNAHAWKLQVTMPDGSDKDFRPVGYYAWTDDGFDDGFFALNPNGYVRTAVFGQNCSVYDTLATTDPIVYYSADGSHIKLVVNPSNSQFTVYYPDGSYYESSINRLTDRYGNYIQSTSFTYGGKSASGIEDSLGRKIFSTAGNQSGETFLYQFGPGGEEVKWTIRSKDMYVRKQYQTTANAGIRERGGTSTQTLEANYEVIEEIVLPEQLGSQSYEFEYSGSDTDPGSSNYSDGWGELTTVTMPSGAVAEYEYVNTFQNTDKILGQGVTKKTLTYYLEYDGGTSSTSQEWNYAIGTVTGTTTVTNPDGSQLQQKHFETNSQIPFNGNVRRIENPNGTMVEKLWDDNPSPWGGLNAWVKMEFTSIKDANGDYTLTAIKEFAQDKNGNITSVKEYDFVPYANVPRTNGYPTGLPSGSCSGSICPVRTSTTTYNNSAPDSSDTSNATYAYWNFGAIKGVAASTEIKNSANVTVSKSEVTYDNYSTTANPTLSRTWDSTKGVVSSPLVDGNSVKTLAEYDQYGNVTETTDGNGNVTTITYGNVTCPSGTVTGLYPTQTVLADGTAIERTSSAVYDCYTGLVTTATDEDNDVSVVTVYDDLGRPTIVKNAYGTTLESWVQTEYHDADRYVVTKADLEAKDDRKKVAIQHFDQLGRVRLSRTLEDASTQSPSNEQHGIKVQTRYTTTYSSPNGYNYSLTSNPYRAATSSAASTEPTMGWTRSKAHHLGRHSEVETFSGASLPAPWGANSSSTGMVQTDIDANATTVTDQAGKLRRSIANALGQLKEIHEPNGSNVLGSVSSPNQATYYHYNTLGKMVRVQQGDQNRYFMYDSLGRMLRVKQPEQDVNTGLNTSGNPDNNSWTAGFTYDNNGNVLTATDAKGTTITNTYDELNRVEQRSYNDSPQTPTVNFYYDGAGLTSVPDFSKGKLTKVSSSVSESRYTEFDLAGRLLEYKQITDGQTYTSEYEYNLSGVLVKETYPISGRVVEYDFDASGDIERIFGKANPSAGERTYANSFSYFADGRIEKLRLGNGLWEAAKINARGQVEEFRLGHGPTSGSLWKNNYEYGELQGNGTVDGTKNSGNIGKQTVTFNGLANPFVQTYQYDTLYRLTEAKETSNGSQTWKQVFDYDRYGNRTTYDKWLGTTAQTLTTVEEPAIDNTTNRISSSGYTFDANGNMIVDADGRQFTFNGDNKQTKVEDDEDNVIGQYFFDGEGKRVKKVVGNDTTIFVYSGSKLIAEYSTETPASNPTTSWTVTDQLGSPRVIVNALAQVVSRRDFMPFGEELGADGTYRTTGQKYGQTDSVRQKFTGYQHDNETGLDFAEARMYQSLNGRFTAIDPLLASGKSADPQTFNRYVYVMNNPIKFSDPSGMQAAEKVQDLYGCSRGPGGCEYTVLKGEKQVRVNTRALDSTTIIGSETAEFASTEASITANLQMPDSGPLQDYMEGEIAAAGKMIGNAVYSASPDYGKFSVGWGNAFLEISVSKDFRFYGGFGGSFNPFDQDGTGGFAVRPTPQFSAGYFVNGVDSEESRHQAMGGANISGTVPVGKYASIGLSKSIPESASVSGVFTPTAIEVGTPAAGAGIVVSAEIDYLKPLRNSIRSRFGWSTIKDEKQ